MRKNNIKIAIIGLGYVGLPLAIVFASKYHVIALDISKNRIDELNNNFDKTGEINSSKIKKNKNKILFTTDYSNIKKSNIIIVTLPTPIFKNKNPNLNIIKTACKKIAKNIKKNDTIIFESTVFPGATRKYFIPILEKYSKFKINNDFYCGYSPERINPGDKKHVINKISKIISASNNKSLNLMHQIYSSVIKAKIYKAPSIEIAEAAKVIENCQRDINVGFINELSIIFDKLNLNTNEILKAAATKWNFLDFKPGLVGGHCIGIDPYYLTHVAKEVGYTPEIILSGRKVNDNMGYEIVKRIIKLLIKKKTKIKKTKFLIMGFTFKENCNDTRNTKVYDIYKNLVSKGAEVEIYDPLIEQKNVKKQYNINFIKKPKYKYYDSVIIAVSHNVFIKEGISNIKKFGKDSALIFDVKNTFPNKGLLYL